MDRAHVNDIAGGAGHIESRALLGKLAQGRPGAQELAGQVDLDHLVPVLQGHVDGSGVTLQA